MRRPRGMRRGATLLRSAGAGGEPPISGSPAAARGRKGTESRVLNLRAPVGHGSSRALRFHSASPRVNAPTQAAAARSWSRAIRQCSRLKQCSRPLACKMPTSKRLPPTLGVCRRTHNGLVRCLQCGASKRRDPRRPDWVWRRGTPGSPRATEKPMVAARTRRVAQVLVPALVHRLQWELEIAARCAAERRAAEASTSL